ncbi:glycine betaine ABC transporter substrate-binding protein [Actinomadura sp. NAK00032]|uniref:glycine betaine ABC transporter substrate-binding protein n=1 Tax=Actinomadura sp. NAK00032 TaxID=2742128 RepID=UPI0015925D8F|nr:glycine betaine ABC transporter substrate-binding protein [Actinomadura sp. NAK00032]QKW35538.1 glycine betaine ABC transporter substrate-binding protein [Actinomadura sp. NAK00032]
MRPPTTGRSRIAVALAAVALTAGCFSSGGTDAEAGSLAEGNSLDGATLTVGSKEFTEQLVLCQVTALALRSAGATVREKCGLQGSNTTRAALTSGSVDMYWEYTGTAWINYLKETEPIGDPAAQYKAVAEQDLAKNKVKWLAAAPANNTYAIAVKTTTMRQLGIESLSDYAALAKRDPGKASTCVASEFAGRGDGWPGLQKAYGFTLPESSVATLAEGAIYDAVGKGEPCAFGETTTTDGRLKALGLTPIPDDKRFFPVYNPALTVRDSVYRDHPAIGRIAGTIAAALTDSVLRELNGRVDIEGKEAAEVAETWLQSKSFIGK